VTVTRDEASGRRVLVAGCGYVGSALAAMLVEDGHEVWGLRRTPQRLPPGVHPLAADLGDPATLADLPDSLDAVVYAAAPGGSADERYREIYVDGVRNLLDALVSQGQRPRRVLLTSTTGVYEDTDGEWVDEESPTEPSDFRGTRPLEGERLLLDGPFPAVVLRLAGIYGPGRTRMIDGVRAGTARCQPGHWTNRIHRDDCAGALRHLLAVDDPLPLYLGVDREPAEACDVQRWLAERLGVAPPRPDPAAPGGRGSNKRVRGDRLLRSGYRLRFPTFREGYGAMLREMGLAS
jgi:nucleoside-diphosphate-sugar epimerase